MRIVALIMAAAVAVQAAELHQKTLAAFQKYMEAADQSMTARAAGAQPRLNPPKGGPPQIVPWDHKNPVEVPDGLIHDWLGAIYVPGAKVVDGVAVLQDIADYPRIYSGDVLTSKLVNRNGDVLRVMFRVIRKKVITVVLETEYDVTYRPAGEGRQQVWSRSVRISEVENHGTPQEAVKPPDTGWGFLWRLNTYWHLEERNGGLLMECRAVSLTRDIPMALSWIIKPMVTSLPREALLGTLEKTRAATAAAAARRASAHRLRPAVPPRAAPAGGGRSVPLPL